MLETDMHRISSTSMLETDMPKRTHPDGGNPHATMSIACNEHTQPQVAGAEPAPPCRMAKRLQITR